MYDETPFVSLYIDDFANKVLWPYISLFLLMSL